MAGTPGETVIETEDDYHFAAQRDSGQSLRAAPTDDDSCSRHCARKLFTDGVDGLLATAHQLGLSEPDPEVSGPRTHDRTVRNPIANDASYGIYYQEIFQHTSC